MKAWKGIVVITYQEEITVLANTKEEAELLMYDKANPMGDGVSGDMTAHDIEEIKEGK